MATSLGQFESITVHTEGPITTIRLNRPEVMNALHTPMHFELQDALDAFAADPGQRIAVLTGTGRAFCAGTDLKYKARMTAEGVSPRFPRHGYGGLIERFDLAKPLLAAVNGVALGGGFEMALACDLIIASSSARFALPEPLVGAVAIGGGLHRLPRQIGVKQALGMILTGRQVSAEEGLRLGFVNEIAPDGDLDTVVARWTDAILKAAPQALAASKQAVMRGLEEHSVADGLRNQERYPAFIAWRASDELVVGPKAFADKQPPPWLPKK